MATMRTLAAEAKQQIALENKAARDAERAAKHIARRAAELALLIAEKRVVRVTYPSHKQDDQQVIHCTAKIDMPDYGIAAGEEFALVESSHLGYYYIVREEGVTGRECSCKGFFYRHSCDHTGTVNLIVIARFHASKGESDEMVMATLPTITSEDERVHVEESIAAGDFPTRKDLDKCALSSNAGFSLMAPSAADRVAQRVYSAPTTPRQQEDW